MSTEARHSSATAEHYTPTTIVNAARALLGGIDLDPASCPKANEVVQATAIFTREDNGFSKPWSGRLFTNPPGGFCDSIGRQVIKRSKDHGPCTETGDCGLPAPHQHDGCYSAQKRWWERLSRAHASGEVTAAVFICFSVELLQTTQVDTPEDAPIPLSFPICFPSKRVPYVTESGVVGGNPPHSSCVIYLPPKGETPKRSAARMTEAFGWLGAVRGGVPAGANPKRKRGRKPATPLVLPGQLGLFVEEQRS